MSMSADASPETISSSGVRRVNNLPIYIVVGIMLAFLLIMMVVAINRSEPQDSNNAEESKKAGSSNMLAAFITGDTRMASLNLKDRHPQNCAGLAARNHDCTPQ